MCCCYDPPSVTLAHFKFKFHPSSPWLSAVRVQEESSWRYHLCCGWGLSFLSKRTIWELCPRAHQARRRITGLRVLFQKKLVRLHLDGRKVSFQKVANLSIYKLRCEVQSAPYKLIRCVDTPHLKLNTGMWTIICLWRVHVAFSVLKTVHFTLDDAKVSTHSSNFNLRLQMIMIPNLRWVSVRQCLGLSTNINMLKCSFFVCFFSRCNVYHVSQLRLAY